MSTFKVRDLIVTIAAPDGFGGVPCHQTMVALCDFSSEITDVVRADAVARRDQIEDKELLRLMGQLKKALREGPKKKRATKKKSAPKKKAKKRR